MSDWGPRDRPAPADALNQYWDALVRGDHAPDSASDLAPGIATEVRRLDALGRRAPGPDREFVKRLQSELEQSAPSAPAELFGAIPTITPNGRYQGSSLERPARSLRRARDWSLTWLATAALIVLTLAAIYYALVVNRNDSGTASPTGTPAQDWPAFRGGPARTGAAPIPGPANVPVERWSVKLGKRLNNPIVAGDTLYVAGGGVLIALDTADGSERWQADLGSVPANDTYSVPVVVGDTLYVGTVGGDLLALDAVTGAQRWGFATGGEVAASPAVAVGRVIVASLGGAVAALDAESGRVLWQRTVGPVRVAPAVDGGLVYIASTDGAVHALDIATGEERWATPSGAPPATLAVAGDAVVVGGSEGTLRSLDAATGNERWRASLGGAPLEPAIVNGAIYVASSQSNATQPLIALDAATGTELWRTSVRANFGSPTAAGDLLFVGTRQRSVYAFDRATGAERYHVTAGPVTTGVAVADGILYVATVNGQVASFGESIATPEGGSG